MDPSIPRVLTMNISHGEARLSQIDPLKHAFRALFKVLPPSARGHVVAIIGELIGTISFLFFAFAGGQVANISSNKTSGDTVMTKVNQVNPAQLLYIALAAGFSLAVNSWTFFRISGGLFNPVVSINLSAALSITLLVEPSADQ